MKRVHENQPADDFPAPLDGIARVAVSEFSGMLPTPGEKAREDVFIAGTEPRTFSDLPKKEREIRQDIVENLRSSLFQMSFDTPSQGLFAEQNPFQKDDRRPGPSDSKNPLLD